MTDLKIFVIILNWNGKQDTLECLKSLQQVKIPHEITLVDNGSTDDSVLSFKKAYPKLTLIETKENLGYAGGNNVGIRYALKKGASHLLILNNDTTVAPDILDNFLKTFETYKEAAILGAKPYLYKDRERIDHLGGNWNQKKGMFDLIASHEKDTLKKWEAPFPIDYVCGCALFAKAKVFHEIGTFESRFFLFWEESDFCFRAREKGFLTFSAPQAKLYHKVSASFTGGKPHTTYFWWRNRLFWIERNCSSKEKYSLIIRVLLPEIFHALIAYPRKSIKLFFLKKFKPNKNLTERAKQISYYRAVLAGVKDYIIRRFGNGPSWIFKA